MKFTARVRAFTSALGGSGFFVAPGSNPLEKEILARRRNAYVFIPKTAEGAAIADLFVSLDSAYFEFKIKSPLRDISKLGEAIDTMKGIVREFRELTSDFAAIANLRFVEPEGLSRVPRRAPRKRKKALPEKKHENLISRSHRRTRLFQSVASHAAGIYQMDYRYSFDGMARDSAHRQTFVICDDACAVATASCAGAAIPGAFDKSLAGPVANAKKKPHKRLPDGGNSETATSEDENEGEHDRGRAHHCPLRPRQLCPERCGKGQALFLRQEPRRRNEGRQPFRDGVYLRPRKQGP